MAARGPKEVGEEGRCKLGTSVMQGATAQETMAESLPTRVP